MGGKIYPYLHDKLLNIGLILALIAGLFSVAGPVRAATAGTTITVTSNIDSLANDGVCTLREAVISANKNASSGSKPKECPAGSSAGVDRIVLPNNLGVFVLTRTDNGKEDSSSTGDLDILGSVIIEASGPGRTQRPNGWQQPRPPCQMLRKKPLQCGRRPWMDHRTPGTVGANG